eukprot:9073187-Ditylum_brightwellii.AAC.1
MNSDNFFRWVKNCLVPAFEKQYPGKKMILAMDNVAYHHKCVIGLLNGLSNEKLIEMAKKYEIDYLDLSFNGQQMEAFDNNSK